MTEQTNFDHIPDVDFSSDIESLQMMIGEEPTAEEAITPEENPQPADTDYFSLDGEQIPIEQAREWISKGKDATKKWQEASELKKQADAQLQRAQWVDELERVWSMGPEGQKAVIDSLTKMSGIPTQGNQVLSSNLNYDELSDEGRVFMSENQQLKAELNHCEATVLFSASEV